jgi:phosphoglycerate dehydrogenase-like enzyme
MSEMPPTIGIFHPEPKSILSIVRAAVPDAEIRICTRWDAIEEIVHDVEVLLAFKFGFLPFPRASILGAAGLKWVQLASAGVDHICPFDPTKITVTNGSGVHGDIISQYVFGMLSHFVWNVPRLLEQQQDRQWDRYPVTSLQGKTLGIVGLGSIGQTLARYGRVYGMRVIGTRRSGRLVEGVDYTYGPDGLPEVMERSDVVVVSTPLTKETRGLIGAVELALMSPHSYLVSISRGGIIDEDALVAALREGRPAHAILDVFDEEPLPPESPFWELPNTLVTPHISGELGDWAAAVADLFVENLRRYTASRPLRNVVDPELGY